MMSLLKRQTLEVIDEKCHKVVHLAKVFHVFEMKLLCINIMLLEYVGAVISIRETKIKS